MCDSVYDYTLIACALPTTFFCAGGPIPTDIATAVSQAQAAHNAAMAAMHAHSFAAVEALPDTQGTAAAAAAAKTPVGSVAAAASHLAAEAAAGVAAADAGAGLAAAAAQAVKDKEDCQEASSPKNMLPHHADRQTNDMGLGQHPSNMGLGQHPSNMGLGQHPSNMGLGQHPSNMGLGQPPSNMGLGQHPSNMQKRQHQHGDSWQEEEEVQNPFPLPRSAEMQPGTKAKTEQAQQQAEEEGPSAQQAEEERTPAQQAEDGDRSIPDLGEEEEHRTSLDQACGTNQFCVGQDRQHATESTCNALLQQQLNRIRQSAVMLPEPAEVLVTDLIDHR